MSRSLKKGPFADDYLLKKVDEYLEKCKADGTLKENAADIIARYELLSNLVKAQQAKARAEAEQKHSFWSRTPCRQQ